MIAGGRPFGQSRRRNPGHSAVRQQVAPQPDHGRTPGMRPMDVMRRQLPMPNTGQMGFARPQSQMPGAQPPQQRKTQAPWPPQGPNSYHQLLDAYNPNKDAPIKGGFTDSQVKWLKQNLLGRGGNVTGREGQPFQNQMQDYITQAGGRNAFMQMLELMPGWQNRQPGPGSPNHLLNNQYSPNFQDPQQQMQRPPPGSVAPEDRMQGPRREGMFPQEAARLDQQPFGRQSFDQQQQIGQQQQTRQGQEPNQRYATQQTQQGAQRTQGGSSPTQPSQQAQRAKARASGGETDPKRQAQKDRDFFGKRGIPLTPEAEQQWRQLQDAYLETLIEIGYSEADAAADLSSQKERLATNYGIDQEQVNEAAAEQGVFNSGQRRQDQRLTNTDYGRQFQDLAMQGLGNEREMANARAAALEALRAGRGEIAMGATRSAVADQYAGKHAGLPTGRRRNRRKSKRRRAA